MTWTYSAIPTLDRDKVRFLVGDTDVNNQLVQDEEIAFAVSFAGTVPLAAATVCEALASRFAQQVDETVGPLSRSSSQRATAFADRAKKLRDLAGSVAAGNAEIFVGGLSIDAKDGLRDDTDRVQPGFSLGQDDNPGTGVNDTNLVLRGQS